MSLPSNFAQRRQRQKIQEWFIENLLFIAGSLSVLITFAILWVLIYESVQFFRTVSLVEFLTGTEWTPLFANPRYASCLY